MNWKKTIFQTGRNITLPSSNQTGKKLIISLSFQTLEKRLKLESNPKSTELPQLHLGLPICIDRMMNWRFDHDLGDDHDDLHCEDVVGDDVGDRSYDELDIGSS